MFRRLTSSQLIVDLVVAAVLLVVTVPFEFAIAGGSALESRFGAVGTGLTGVTVAVIFAVALALRRLSPALALGIAWSGALVQMAFGRPPSIADVAIFGVLYVTAAYGTRAVYWAGFASA
ncbi:hypothetical protein WCE10_21590, partial [Cronobacter muytjensii]|uniref:DUF7134 domain-containing protein n=1 Tax=Cronobacter muytjensii TaxID=413501 RepID=UPI0034D70895